MQKSIAFIVYGGKDPARNALQEDNYKALADALIAEGYNVESILYHDSKADELKDELMRFYAALVWVNPIEQGEDRRHLDALLREIAAAGVFVSTHPDVIMKIGTKEVLYTTRSMDWGGDTEIYRSYDDFAASFADSLTDKPRILKQYRGNGGNGVFKIEKDGGQIKVAHAAGGNDAYLLTKDALNQHFKPYFDNGGLLINQAWNEGISNGMVRCYLTRGRVSGFGYQESVALGHRATAKRFYFSEECGLFQDLRGIMEGKWVAQICDIHGINADNLPLLWDVDLFINNPSDTRTESKYTICEINVSCVSPFPPSCIEHVVEGLRPQ